MSYKRIIILVALAALCLSLFTSCKNPLPTNEVTETPTTKDPHEGMVQAYLSDGSTAWIRYYENVEKNDLLPTCFAEKEGFIEYSDPRYTATTGIDVSEFQNEIDWEAVAADGIDFAIIRVGYRGWGQSGTIREDSEFKHNLTAAKAAGLDVGVYFYSQAVNSAEAVAEADFVLNLIRDYELSLPVFFDWEEVENNPDARTANIDKSILTELSLAFCRTIEQAGYRAGVYYYQDLAYNYYNLELLDDFVIWHSEPNSVPRFYYAFDMWQYTYSGKVSGIEGKVDLNLKFDRVSADG